jgi:hypothetical protein
MRAVPFSAQLSFGPVDTTGMPHRIRLDLPLTADERRRLHELADRERLTIKETVRAAIELAIARGSTR